MDFDIGNILYIVITLVVVIVGLLGKKKKPGATGNEGDSGESRPGFFENLEKAFNMEQQGQVVDLQEDEEVLFEEEEKAEPAPEPISNTLTLTEEYERLVDRRQKEDPSDMNLSRVDNISEPMEVLDLDDEGGTDYFEVVKEFDAGTAVVYAAIINRVDY